MKFTMTQHWISECKCYEIELNESGDFWAYQLQEYDSGDIVDQKHCATFDQARQWCESRAAASQGGGK